jgi:signal transduction histidine kinase
MRFSIRSLGNLSTIRSWGDKLILITSLILLACLLFLLLAALELFTLYDQHTARNNAIQQIMLMREQYQAASQLTLQEATTIATDERIITIAAQPAALTPDEQQNMLATLLLAHPYLGGVWVVAKNSMVLAHLDRGLPPKQVSDPYLKAMVDQALQGYPVSTLRQVIAADVTIPSTTAQWVLEVAVPIGPTGSASHVLIITRQLDDVFAQTLIAGNIGEDDLLCINQRVFAGTAVKNTALSYPSAQIARLCTPGNSVSLGNMQYYVTLAASVRAVNQLASSPSLVLVAVQPVWFSRLTRWNVLLVLVGIGLFIFGLGIVSYAFITHHLFIRPLRKLDTNVRALVVSKGQAAASAVSRRDDELSTLSRSFSLLSESLDSENQAIIEQITHLLILSDALISTLHLEPLLAEIVSQLGKIMQVKNATLLLYGFDMPTPWAVAQWTRQSTQASGSLARLVMPSELEAQPQGAVTVHADPTGDITMAPTTKMVAIPSNRQTPSGKNNAVQPPKPGNGSTQSVNQQTGPRSRIPRPSLRDLDMILARIVMRRKKFAHSENIPAIPPEKRELWATMALEAGYRSVIAVPLLLQNRAMGAFMLYSDQPCQVSSRDTFLLSTAAIQASMAIQNALLFAEAKEKNAALERANQLKSQFLANVTHELRTPLHSIISYGSLILEGFVDGELTKEQEGYIQFMVRSAEDLSDLVNDMLDLSKIEADRLEINIEPLNVAQSLSDVVNHLKPLADNKQLMLKLELEEGLPLVLADSHRLRQVLINLVSNALKFTEQGEVTISSTYMRGDDTVRIAVRDTGIGISPAALGYIFEAFRQADGSTTRRFGGTGLGLTIAKKLIELQGGEVAVESIVGEGSTFSFILPIAAYAHEPLLQRMP